jgi:[acyl-carrier-protein] S-malonyltransferase/trans-AT polyketide synthase/acyltransferase/oxidoreductase domain-containing protein
VLAFVYPGQGSQKVGMGRDFHDAYEIARRTFEEASEALSLDVATLCFTDDTNLALTEFAQPAILATEIAMTGVLRERGAAPTHFAGHSLGEYTALVAAGALPFDHALRLVRERGRLMQSAVPVGEGGMTAVTRAELDLGAIESAIDGLVVDVANHNSPEQVVISGRAADLRVAESRIVAKLTPLAVSAPFHSRMMRPIEEPFRAVLPVSWGDARAVLSNFTGTWHTTDPTDALVRQISGRVRWVDNMRALEGMRVVEVGPSRPLRAFFRAMGVAIDSVTNVTTAERLRI